jgi:hypothetical protein
VHGRQLTSRAVVPYAAGCPALCREQVAVTQAALVAVVVRDAVGRAPLALAAAVTEAAARLRQRLAELKAKAAAVPPAELAFEQGTKLAELERQASFDTARTAPPESRTLSGGAVQPAAPSPGGDAAGTDGHNGEGDGGGLERLTSVATEFSDDAYEGSMLEQASFASMSTTSDVADVTELGGFRDEVPQNDQGDTAVEDLDEGGGGGGSAAAKEEAAPPKS